MWEADEEQRGRIQTLAKAFLEEIPAAWAQSWAFSPESQQKVVEKLKAHFDIDFLDQAMSEFSMFPAENDFFKHWVAEYNNKYEVSEFAHRIAEEWIFDRRSDYAIHLAGKRLQYLILHLEYDPIICDPDLRPMLNSCYAPVPTNYFHITECVRFLLHCKDNPIALSYVEKLLSGQWNGAVTFPKLAKMDLPETTRYEVLQKNQRICSPLLRPAWSDASWLDVFEQLTASGWLDYDRCFSVFQTLPRFIPFDLLNLARQIDIHSLSPHKFELYKYLQRLVREIIQEWDSSYLKALYDSDVCFYGPSWLFAACERIEKLGLSALIEKGASDYPIKILKKLAGAHELRKDETAEVIVERLRQFSEQTLLAVLPFSEGGKGLVWQALDWTDLQPIFSWVFGEVRRVGENVKVDAIPDRAFISNLLQSSNIERLRTLIEQWKLAKIEPGFLIYLEAVAGWNRASLKSSIEKYHKQTAIHAYGLLPLEGENELFERYLFFKKVAKDCSKYGAERQANTRFAVQAGLECLSQTAGYPDMARMEWDMEAKVTDDGAPLNQLETIGDWQVELILAGLSPQINVYKQNKPLKSAPAGIKKLARYLEFKETQTRMKAQIPRFRASLEKLMTDGDALSVDDLKKLSQLPIMKQLLQSVILRTEDGQYGLFNPQDLHLIGLDNQKIAVAGPVLVPHPYHFFQDGVLSDWQREVVRKRVVQPFKQAFRELYVLTPAEEQTAFFSNRFAGHVLKPTVAGSLLQNRGWKPVHYDYSVVSKFFRKAALSAEFVFPDAESYLGGLEEITSDQLRFVSKTQPVLLKDVPPLIFSEVMRDADLVVSVAQLHEGDGHWSAESYQRRVELVNEIINDLGLKGVSCDGHFAYIQGKLANYRVHLGSAVIHIQPGNYLCIVPSRDPNKNEQAFFLPIADAEPKTSEVISKILLLVNDNKIKDQSILSQIEASQTV